MSINVAAIPSPFIHATIKRRKNTWYTIASGNWSDPNIWMSNSRRRYGYPSYVLGGQNANATIMPQFPSANDDVFINHSVVLDVSTTTAAATVNNLYISGSLTMNNSSARGITVVGDLQVNGSVDISGAAHTLALYGVNNYINSFASGTTSTVNYMRAGDQYIMDLSYRNLGFFQSGTKYLTNNLNIAGNLASQSLTLQSLTIECLTFNLTVSGTTSTNGGVISKTGSGSLLFVGQYSFSTNAIQGVSFFGNPTVEFRGGINVNGGASIVWNTGTSTWSFTTNAQTVSLGTITYSWTAPISIIGAITVNEAGTGIMSLNQPIDCTSASGSVMAKGTIYFNSTSSLPSFTTGTFDRTSFANTVGYTMGASITLPYTSYSSLLVSNTGTKTALGNTTLSGNLTVSNAVTAFGILDLAAFDLSVSGTTNVTGTLQKSGSGNVLFVGSVSLSTASLNTSIDFRGGNPNVEVRGGLNIATSVFYSGTGQWKFSTNSQTLTVSNGSGVKVWDWSVLISGAITLTVSGGGSSTLAMATFNTINGDNAASKLLNAGTILFASTVSPMATGIFDNGATTAGTVLGYIMNADYVIPYTSFKGLVSGGTGTKTFNGDVTVAETLAIGVGTNSQFTTFMQLGANSLTVTGTTTLNGAILKSGAGNVLFNGAVNFGSGASGGIDFSGGNPTVEIRNGISIQSGGFVTGTGAWSFTTNNQSIGNASGTKQLDSAAIISGAITLTLSSGSTFIFTNTINGNNAASTFDNRGTVQYQATQQPMLTGVLQTNLAANTFLYNAAGNQDVKGGTYRTLTLAGSGVKTLQGNVVVATLYTLTPPATLALNGFTRT